MLQRPMTADQHLDTLLQGEHAWNQYRQEHAGAAVPDFSGAHFAHANFSGFDLHGVVLHRAYLRGAALRGACLRECDLRGAYLIDADLERADLSRARLLAVNLNGANLAACVFQEADLREADCGGADLTGADFTGADLLCVNLLGANLEAVRFVRTKGLSSRQIMAARNWDKALFDPALVAQLDLPLVRETESAMVAEEAVSLESDARQRTEAAEHAPQPRSNRTQSSRSLATLSCYLDPSLG